MLSWLLWTAFTRVCSDVDMSQNGKVNVVQSWGLLEVKFPSDASGLFTHIRVDLPGCDIQNIRRLGRSSSFKLETAPQADQSIPFGRSAGQMVPTRDLSLCYPPCQMADCRVLDANHIASAAPPEAAGSPHPWSPDDCDG